MAKIKIRKMAANSNDPSVKAYEQAVMQGVSELNDEQRKILKDSIKETHLNDSELKKLLKPKKSILALIIQDFRSAFSFGS